MLAINVPIPQAGKNQRLQFAKFDLFFKDDADLSHRQYSMAPKSKKMVVENLRLASFG